MDILIIIIFIAIAYLIIYVVIASFIYKGHQKIIAHLNGLTQATDINFEASLMMRHFLSIIAIGIFMFDFSNTQDELDFAGAVLFPIIALFGTFFFGLMVAIYHFMFHTSLYFLLKCHDMVHFYRLYFLLSVLSIVIFELIWWLWFYTDISLERRVWGWNLVLIVFPLIPMAGLFIKSNQTET